MGTVQLGVVETEIHMAPGENNNNFQPSNCGVDAKVHMIREDSNNTQPYPGSVQLGGVDGEVYSLRGDNSINDNNTQICQGTA